MSDVNPPATPEPTPYAAAPGTPPAAPEPAPYVAPAAPQANPYAAPGVPPAAPGVPPAAPYGSAPYAGAPVAVPKTLSLISMIVGIVGLLAVGWFGIASIAALILGYMGKKREPAAKAFWLTGIITGWVGVGVMIIVMGLLIIGIIAAVVSGGASTGYSTY